MYASYEFNLVVLYLSFYISECDIFSLQNSNRCSNCISKCPMQQLAVVLESIWCQISCTRLAFPFLRPLLPDDIGSVSGSGNSSGSGSDGDTVASLPVSSTKQVADLLDIIEKVRRFGYSSVAQFRSDISLLEGMVGARLASLLPSKTEKRECMSILHAFQTIAAHADTLIGNRQEVIRALENSISSKFEDGEFSEQKELSSIEMYWRKECERMVFAGLSQQQQQSTTARDHSCRVSGRPLKYWAIFLESTMVGKHVLECGDKADREVVDSYLATLGVNELVRVLTSVCTSIM